MLPKKQVVPVVITSEETKKGCTMINLEMEAEDTNVKALVPSQGKRLAPKSKKGRKPKSDGARSSSFAELDKGKATMVEDVVA